MAMFVRDSFFTKMSARAHWRLLRWLGPWAQGKGSPGPVARRQLHLPAELRAPGVEALVYRPTDRAPIGSYLLAHGLNPQGPDDARCDRFARVLAHAGFLVMVPRLSAFTQLRVDASAGAELSRALQALVDLPEHPGGVRPGLFSISFGSFPALLTAASPDVGPLLGSLIVFGGYADFLATCRFMMGADPAAPEPDPTCMVGLALNVAPLLFAGETAQVLTTAWRAFVAQVWAAPDMKDVARLGEVARILSVGLPVDLVEVFLQGCGVQSGFAARVEDVLTRIDVDGLEPRGCLHAVRCPVHLFHGRNDDVIPCSQMDALAAGLTGVRPRTYLTGLYDHSRSDGDALGLRRLTRVAHLRALAGEVKTMAAMVHALVVSGMATA
jgi:pimeloyl-ACP methyl ester carboxylesterase